MKELKLCKFGEPRGDKRVREYIDLRSGRYFENHLHAFRYCSALKAEVDAEKICETCIVRRAK